MREIKFRAWDVKTGAYVIPAHTMNIHTGQISDLPDRFILEQFTGLHDKNGRDIYEGDIVRDDFDEIRTIKWFDDLGYDGGGATHSGFYFDNTWEGRGELSYHNHMNECEVIGNIHENPELLA